MPDTPSYATVLEALAGSVDRLRALVEPLDEGDLTTQAYPTEWTVAQVLSHIGSGAVILGGRLADARSGVATDDGFAPSVWAEWDAKTPTAQAADALTADAAMLAALRAVPEDEQGSLQVSLGPMALPLAVFAGLRLNEHALHSWDVAVTFDPAAGVAPEATEVVIDNLAMIAGFAGKPVGDRRIAVVTTGPERRFTLVSTDESVQLEEAGDGDADVTLPAEALIRLVYGRLDPDHAPIATTPALDTLRAAFPGA